MGKEILRDIRNLLEYHESLGLKEIPLDMIAARTKKKSRRRGGVAHGPAQALEELRADIGECTRCRLHHGRTHLVFGVGDPRADLMFIGEGPGRDEDIQGEPFVGRAGQLLTRIIEAMGFKRKDVYIANIVKCRPPQNRVPAADEAAICLPFLVRQVEIIKPRVIVCLGSVAVQHLLQTEAKITRLRGQWQEWRGIPVMPTYHPAFLLRNPNMKKPVWEDMQEVMKLLASS